MKKDIVHREDIELVINKFYERVLMDDLLPEFFTKVIQVNWKKHLPVMYAFWENVVFYTGGYEGNPLEIHRKIHAKSTLKKEHFDRWVKLFTQTVDEHFEGEKAELMKSKASSIATIMQIKIIQ